MVLVGIKELKAKLSSYVDKARLGEEVVVTEHGKEVALLVPVSEERRRVMGLAVSGRARWSGGKPGGVRGIKVKGRPMSETVLEGRR